MVKRFECLKLLATLLDEHALTVTSRGGSAREWAYLRPQGANFHSLNMGTCMSFAVGLALAFPKRKVIALDSDGSLLLDTSSLVTLAEVNPPNLLALVFDNQAYANMEAGIERARFTTPISQLVAIPIVQVIFAGILLGVFTVLGGDATFKQVLAIVAHSGVITALHYSGALEFFICYHRRRKVAAFPV